MTPGIPLEIHAEKPESAPGEAMREVRAGLDSRKIEPTEFTLVPMDGIGIALDIRFRDRRGAAPLERAFA